MKLFNLFKKKSEEKETTVKTFSETNYKQN